MRVCTCIHVCDVMLMCVRMNLASTPPMVKATVSARASLGLLGKPQGRHGLLHELEGLRARETFGNLYIMG